MIIRIYIYAILLCVLSSSANASKPEFFLGFTVGQNLYNGSGDGYYWEPTGIYPSESERITFKFELEDELGWDNKSFLTFRPFVGINFDSTKAIFIGVNNYVEKTGRFNGQYDTKYRHYSIQLSLLFNNTLLIGAELHSIEIDCVNFENSEESYKTSTNTLGLVFGIERKARLTKLFSLVFSLTYSLANTSYTDLLPFVGKLEGLNIGGINLNGGIQINL